MTKTIYLIDPETGALLGESLHPLDPVETERSGEPVYALLNPALAVEDAPPAVPAGMRVIRADGAWTLEALPEPEAPEIPEPVPEPPAPAEPTLEERVAAMRAHVQEYMDAMARALGYDDIATAVTYAEEPAVPKFQNEGRALRAWRSMVWAACYDLLERVQKGEAEEPTMEALYDLLPALSVPESDPALEQSVPDPTPKQLEVQK